MVKKRMAMRMVTIFVALIVCGMFFPNPARGDENLSSNQGLDVDFEDVVVGEDKTIPLEIRNESDHQLILYPLFNMDAACEFTSYKMEGDSPTDLGRTELAVIRATSRSHYWEMIMIHWEILIKFKILKIRKGKLIQVFN